MIGARGGIGVLLVIIAALYFSGAGNWALTNMRGLDAACYNGLTRLGAQFANPACAALAKGISAIDSAASNASARLEHWKESIFASDDLSKIRALSTSFGNHASRLASSGDELSRMLSAGPGYGAGQSPFQRGIDFYSLGQGLLKQSGSGGQGLQWLQLGAQQPQGYGLMSQLSLGNLYANGGPGVAVDPQRAEYYLQQARQSLQALSSSQAPQAQQLLGSLPGNPENVKAQIDRAIVQLRGQN